MIEKVINGQTFLFCEVDENAHSFDIDKDGELHYKADFFGIPHIGHFKNVGTGYKIIGLASMLRGRSDFADVFEWLVENEMIPETTLILKQL